MTRSTTYLPNDMPEIQHHPDRKNGHEILKILIYHRGTESTKSIFLPLDISSCDRLFSAMGSTTIAELEKATAQMVAGV